MLNYHYEKMEGVCVIREILQLKIEKDTFL